MLKAPSRIIFAETRFYYVSGGFDTHGSQAGAQQSSCPYSKASKTGIPTATRTLV